MPISPLRLIKNSVEYCTRKEIGDVPRYTRGIYVLYKYRPHYDAYNVVYVGMAGGENAGVRGRLRRHLGVSTTARNWRTVRKLLDLAKS
jgi:uncharacterized protein (DUF1697 family)